MHSPPQHKTPLKKLRFGMASTNTKDFLAKAFFVDGISNSIFFQRLSLLHFYIRILDRKKYTLLLICHVDGVDLFTFSTRF